MLLFVKAIHTIKGEWDVKACLSCLLLELTKSLSSCSCCEVLCVGGEAEGGGGTRVEGQVGGGEGVVGGELVGSVPGMKAQKSSC